MPFQWNIQINLNPQSPPRVTFSPNPLPVVVRDQIFWTNNDPDQPHWPGKLNDDGTIVEDFFMPNQIASGGDSSATWSPIQDDPPTYDYACSLHPDEKGTINVSAS
jgi:plastocyanin